MKLPSLPGVSVTIRAEDRDLTEYDIHDLDKESLPYHTVAKYVESTAGADFSIRVLVKLGYRYRHDDISAYTFLDGVLVNKGTISALREERRKSVTFRGRTTYTRDTGLFHGFQFARLITNDSATGMVLTENSANIGVISVELRRSKIDENKVLPIQDSLQWPKTVAESGVPEEALKGRSISNVAKLGAPIAIAARLTTCYMDYPYGREPIGIFQFRYRAHRDLQIEGIIPGSPSPVTLEKKDPDDLTAEEARELVRRQRAQLAQVARVKQEKRELTAVAGADGYEQQQPRRKRHQGMMDSSVEVIDLSED